MFLQQVIQKLLAVFVSLGLFIIVTWARDSSTLNAPVVCSISSFTQARTYPLPYFPYSITVGDFNSDMRPDIAIGSSILNGGVSVMLNDGVGRFGSDILYQTGTIQQDVVTGDFNHDGNLDIAASNFFDDSVSILLGTVTGSFAPALNMPTGGTFPKFLATGDINHDSNLDLIVDNAPESGSGGNISVLLGDGAGHFTITTPIGSATGWMRAADFNGDGNLDIIGVINQLRFYLGNGNGSFTQQQDVMTGIPVTSFTIGDLNNDNKPDIVAVSGSDTISVIMGNGNGTFRAPTIYQISVIRVGSYVAIGDVNGDGFVDIVVTNHSSMAGRVHVLLGNGTGIFTLAGSYLTNSQSPNHVEVPDLNGDGRADIVIGNGSHDISVLISTCLTPTPRYDFDGDGKSDISVFRPSSGFWYSLLSSTNSFAFQQWGISTDRIVPADYDGDSKTDLAVYRPSSGAWFILRSTNNTFIAQAFGLSTDVSVPADYDADGRTDLAVYRAGSWYILKSSDNQLISQSFGTATDKPMSADYDGDGKADIAVYRPSDGTWYMQQSANGSFRAQPFGANNDVPVTGDFDGDGRADVAVYRPLSGTWYALRSSNSSLLAKRWGVDTDVPVAADYDGDGKTDVAVFRPTNGTWYILRSSDGMFTSQQFGLTSDVPVPAGY
jgi:hypothetical protein